MDRHYIQELQVPSLPEEEQRFGERSCLGRRVAVGTKEDPVETYRGDGKDLSGSATSCMNNCWEWRKVRQTDRFTL